MDIAIVTLPVGLCRPGEKSPHFSLFLELEVTVYGREDLEIGYQLTVATWVSCVYL